MKQSTYYQQRLENRLRDVTKSYGMQTVDRTENRGGKAQRIQKSRTTDCSKTIPKGISTPWPTPQIARDTRQGETAEEMVSCNDCQLLSDSVPGKQFETAFRNITWIAGPTVGRHFSRRTATRYARQVRRNIPWRANSGRGVSRDFLSEHRAKGPAKTSYCERL
jgi:hypothetical protein